MQCMHASGDPPRSRWRSSSGQEVRKLRRDAALISYAVVSRKDATHFPTHFLTHSLPHSLTHFLSHFLSLTLTRPHIPSHLPPAGCIQKSTASQPWLSRPSLQRDWPHRPDEARHLYLQVYVCAWQDHVYGYMYGRMRRPFLRLSSCSSGMSSGLFEAGIPLFLKTKRTCRRVSGRVRARSRSRSLVRSLVRGLVLVRVSAPG